MRCHFNVRFKAYLRRSGLIQPGERIAIAVSGGADSVALLRLMLELRSDMGFIISVAHFNHQIRGAASDADEQFVRDLARTHDLDFHSASGNAPAHAARTKQSLETAARELRYNFFRDLLALGKASKIATAHSMDDQAETLLMRFVRGAGTRGLAGIYPSHAENRESSVIRPVLGFRRADLRAYLEEKNQAWREDSTNSDLDHTRNSIRHELLPLLAEKYNPAIVETLARTAEVARAEEEYWTRECKRLLPLLLLPSKPVRGGGRAASAEGSPSFGLNIEALQKQPLALQRRLIRSAAAPLNLALSMDHVEEVLNLLKSPAKNCEMPEGWMVEKGLRELRFQRRSVATRSNQAAARDYEYSLPVPGDLQVPEINSVVHARLLPLTKPNEGYNHSLSSRNGESLTVSSLDLKLRNWRPGDRFRPAHAGSEKKVKELLQSLKVEQPGRALWPVVAAGEQVIWVRGTRPRTICLERNGVRHNLVIEVEETRG